MVNATSVLKIVIQVVDKATPAMTSVNRATKTVDKTIKSIGKGMSTFDARFLSLLFGGMALQRLFGGMLRSITQTFIKAEDNTSGLTQATNRLGASWEFLKFSIFDALNTDFFIGMIDGIITVIDNFSQMGAEAKLTILGIISGLALIGGGLLFIGQFKLFWNSVFATGGLLNAAAIGGILIVLALIAVIGITIGKKWDELKDIGVALWDNLKAPLTSIKTSLDDIAQVTGFEDIFDLIATVGVSAFRGLAIGIFDTVLVIDVFIDSLSTVIKIIVAIKNLDFKELGKLLGGTGSRVVDKVTGVVNAHNKFVDVLDKIQERRELAKQGMSVEEAQVAGGFIGLVEDPFSQFDKSQEALMSIDTGTQLMQTSAKTYEKTLAENVIPEVDNLITTLTGEGGLLEGFKLQGTEMDTISGDKTTNFKNASNSRIDQIDKEISKYNEFISKQAEALARFEERIERFANQSSVSSDEV